MARQSDLYPLLDKYADALSAKLGRPADEIREKGLSAHDFGETLDITFCDGSTASWKWGFFVVSADERGIAIFTEHLGYHEFAAYELRVKVGRKEVFRSRYPEGWRSENWG